MSCHKLISILRTTHLDPSKRESSTSIDYIHALCTHNPSLNGQVKCLDRGDSGSSPPVMLQEVHWTLSFRGRRNPNKVFVGEPVEGSLSRLKWTIVNLSGADGNGGGDVHHQNPGYPRYKKPRNLDFK